MATTLTLQIDQDGIALITLAVPGKPMNVITPELQADLAAAVERVATDAAIKGAVITSAGGAFLAGADLKDMATVFARHPTLREAADWVFRVSTLYRRLETCGKPVAAAINGLALGGGFELCLACHYRVLVDDPKAVVGLPEVQVGLLPGAGGTQRLPRLIGIEKSLPLLLEGKHQKPADALKLGLVHAVVPAADVLPTAKRWVLNATDAQAPWDKKGFRVPGGAGIQSPGSAQAFMVGTALVAKTTNRNFPAPVAILSAVFEGVQVPIDTGLRIESKYFARLLTDPVARNLIRTLFVNKGLADKLARRPQGVPNSEVRKLGVLGAGMMGAGIAYVSARAGMQVVLLDSTAELAAKGKAYSRGLYDKDLHKGRATAEQAQAVLARIEPTTDYARLEGCDLVIEAVFEKREIKADVTAKTEAVIPKTAVFASNTSTLPITGLARASCRPQQFIGIHFFSPVEKMPLVEIIVGKRTSQATIARALDYVAQLRKTPIVVNDSPGFYTSRVFSTFAMEGLQMLEEGIEPALIENAARLAGMPVGPLAVSDEVSIDLQWKIMQQGEADLGAKFRKPVGYEVVRRFVLELDRRGRRFGAGFYEYPGDGRKFLWPGLAQLYPRRPVQPTVEELKSRFLCIQALETVRCVEEGVIDHPADADVGSVLAWGFPAWTGGTLSYIDSMGAGRFVAECQRLARAWGPRFRPTARLKDRAARGESFHAA